MSDDTLDRARAGDEHAFRELTEPYRHELSVHCYRLLGSLTDAEDLLQETMIAAWRGLGGFAERASLRSWLYRIATNRCLNALRDAGRRRPPEPTPPFDPPEPSRRQEVTWLQPCPDTLLTQVTDNEPGPEARYGSREAVELAFVASLQRLPPRQITVLVLRDVLGYSTAEAADLLGTSTTVIRGALQRARNGLARQRPATDPAAVAPPDSARERALAVRFADAFTAGDVDGVVALLTDDAWLAMPPAPHAYHRPDVIAAFLSTFFDWRGRRRMRTVPTRANNAPAFGCYLTEPGGGTAYPAGIVVLDLTGDRIDTIHWFLDDELFARFALPATLD